MSDCEFAFVTPGVVRCAACGRELETRMPRPELVHRPCPAANDEDLPCRHRGAESRRERCRLCGDRERLESVFACALHGECTRRKWKVGGAAPRVCLTCDDREPFPDVPA